MFKHIHTPGPWLAIRHENRHYSVFSEKDGGKLVARTDYTHKEQEANASLIAAAPEMLGALRSLVTAICEAKIDNLIPEEFADQELDEATKIIRKAEGSDQ